MATITPSVVNSPKETSTSKGGYLRLTITSITDSDAETNKRYIGCKLTIEGTRWVGLYRWESTLGGQTVSTETRTVEDWYPGHVLATKNLTFDNDSAGNLSLTAYIKHIFYKGSGSWNTSYAKSITETLVCSQLPRYANFTSHSATSTLNTITVSYAADATYGAQQYSLDSGSWTNCTAGSYTLNGFTPGSSHTIKTRIQRSDSGLWTESSQISISLKSLPTSNNVSNINFNSSGTRVDVSISSKDYLSQWYVKIYDGNTLVRDGSNAPNYASSTSDYWTIQNSDNSDMLNRHGSVNSWTLTVKFYVISNGTTYELSSKTCTCTIPSGSYLPTYNSNNLSYAVQDTESNNITGSNQKVIKGISDVRISTTQASPQGGASMSSYTATSGTKSGTSTSLSNTYIDLSNVDSNSFSVQATDTRGRSTVASKSYSTYIDYFAPYINSGGINIARVDGVTANLNISISGKYMNWSGLSTPNTITQVAVQYKLRSSSSWTTLSGFNLSISASNGNFTASGITTGNVFNIGNEYDIKIILKDRFKNVEATGIIHTANVLLWKDLVNHRLGIGKKPNYTLDISGNFSYDGLMYSPTMSNSEFSKIRLLPRKTYSQLGVAGSDMAAYFKVLLKWICDTYPTDTYTTYIGQGHPGATGNILIHIYNNSTRDGSTQLPQYATGQYWQSGQGWFFSCWSYTFEYYEIAKTSQLPDMTHVAYKNSNNNFSTNQTINGTLQVNGIIQSDNINGFRLNSDYSLTSDPTNSFQTKIFGSNNAYSRIKAIRASGASYNGFPNYGASFVASVGDTHAFLSTNYSSSHAYVGGGNADKIQWYKEIAWTDQLPTLTNGNITFTKSSGNGNMLSGKWWKFGNVMYLEIVFKTNGGSTSVGSNIWSGKVSGITLPYYRATGSGYYSGSHYIAGLYGQHNYDGGSTSDAGRLDIRALGQSVSSNSDAHSLSITYIIP